MNTIKTCLFRNAMALALFASVGLASSARASTAIADGNYGTWNNYSSLAGGTWSSVEMAGDDAGEGLLEVYLGNQSILIEDGTDDAIGLTVTDITYDSMTGDYWGYINYTATAYGGDVYPTFTNGDYVDIGTGDADWEIDGGGDAQVTIFGGDDEYYTSYDGAIIGFN